MASAESPCDEADRVLHASTDLEALALSGDVTALNEQTIQRAYKKLALRLHPDKHTTRTPDEAALLALAFQRAADARDRALVQLDSARLAHVVLLNMAAAPPRTRTSVSHNTCAPSHSVAEMFPCIHNGCSQQTDVAGTECNACLFRRGTPGASVRAVCMTFGCLRLLRTPSERETGVCTTCRAAPRTCEMLGCLKRAKEGEKWCVQHCDKKSSTPTFPF